MHDSNLIIHNENGYELTFIDFDRLGKGYFLRELGYLIVKNRNKTDFTKKKESLDL